MGDYTVLVIIGVVVVVLVVIAVVLSAVRRFEEEAEEQGKGTGERRVRNREADLAELDQQGRMLYQLIEWQDRAYQEQLAQGRVLGRIAMWVTLFGIVWLLGLALACVWGLLGGFSLVSLLS